MNLLKRIEAFARLGYLMQESGNSGNQPIFLGPEEQHSFEELQFEIADAPHYNGWFTESNVRKAISSLGKSMTMEHLEKWLKQYPEHLAEINGNHSIGLVMAGKKSMPTGTRVM